MASFAAYDDVTLGVEGFGDNWGSRQNLNFRNDSGENMTMGWVKVEAPMENNDMDEDSRPQLRRRLCQFVQGASIYSENNPVRLSFFTQNCTTGCDHVEPSKFTCFMEKLVIDREENSSRVIQKLVKWATILIAVCSAFLYTSIEISLYETSTENTEEAVLCAMRVFSSLLVTIPNIAFREELKKLLAREHSRMILQSVQPRKFVKICACFCVFELAIAGGSTYYWIDTFLPEVQAGNISYSGVYPLLVVHPLSVTVTNLWNFSIAVIGMMICSHLIDEIQNLVKALHEDRVLCEISFATTEVGRCFALRKYPLLVHEAKHLSRDDVERLNESIFSKDDILARYYDLQMKLNAASVAFQKWFLINIVGIFVTVFEFLFVALGSGGRYATGSVLLVCTPLFWVPLLLQPVMNVNLKAATIIHSIYPTLDRLPVFQRFVSLPLSFHVYGQRMSRTSIAAFITVLLVGFIGRIWNLISL